MKGKQPSNQKDQYVLKPVLSQEEVERLENYEPTREVSDEEFLALIELSRTKGKLTVEDLNELTTVPANR